MNFSFNKKGKRGFVALVTILVISGITLIVGSTILLKSITESQTIYNEEKATQAWAGANACVEHALLGLTGGTSAWDGYSGNESVSVNGTDCFIFDVTSTGTSKLIRASSTISDFTRKIQVIVATNTPSTTVYSWQEVGDF